MHHMTSSYVAIVTCEQLCILDFFPNLIQIHGFCSTLKKELDNLYVAKSFRFMFRLPFVKDDEKGLMDNECEVASDIHGEYVNL